jgi:hypothetical protein
MKLNQQKSILILELPSNLWRVNLEGFKMETNITKPKQSELEAAVIAFLS